MTRLPRNHRSQSCLETLGQCPSPGARNRSALLIIGLTLLISVLMAMPASAQTISVTDDSCVPYPVLPQQYDYLHEATGWMGIAVVSETGQNVHIEALDGESGPVLHSSEMPGETNFLVHQWLGGSDTGHFRALTDEGPLNIQHLVDYDPGQGTLPFETEISGNYGSVGYDCGLLRVWNANLVAGNTYLFDLDSDADSGHLEIRAALLRTGGSHDWLARADALWDVPARTNTWDPGLTFTVPQSGSYALVVFRNGYHNEDVWDSEYHFTLENLGASSSAADLVVQSIYPSSTPENQVFDLDITIRNNGTVASAPCQTTVWVDGMHACPAVATPAIAPQQSVQLAACAMGPYGAGSIEVLVETDTYDEVEESDETNNQDSRTISIVALLPDLMIVGIEPVEAVPFHPVDFEITIANIGLSDAQASETSFSLDFMSPCGNLATPPIPAGGSVTVLCQVASLEPGYHTLGATADSEIQISESDEFNNSIGSYLNAQGPDLTVLDFSPRELTNAEAFSLEILVRNEGSEDMPSCYASIVGDAGPLVAPFLIPVIPHGDEVLVASPLIDPLPAGTAQIMICVDANDNTLEYYEDNNCLAGEVDVLALQATVFPDGHGDYPSIQAAIDAVAPGGTVMLAYGVFTGDGNRDISFNGKELTVRGTGRTPDRCTIDCQGSSGDQHRAFVFENGEGSDAVLENFTIINGWMTDHGGAVRITAASPTLQNLVFRDNRSNLHDGGAVFTNASFILEDCLFDGNRASGEPPEIMAQGGALACVGSNYTVRLERNTFVNNQADEAGALWASSGSSGVVLVDNCLFTDNSSAQGTVDGLGSIVLDLECCDVWDNTGGDWDGAIAGQLGYEGNISADPLFCDFSGGDYSLHADSPCAEDNAAGCGQIGAFEVGCAISGQSVYSVLADGTGAFATIQAALASASPGDVIELGDGIFTGDGNRDLSFSGKDLIVRSQSGNAEDCIIDCGGSAGDPHRAFSFTSDESSAAEVLNLTIRYGFYAQGGGVSIVGAAPTFTGCVFQANQASGSGGAVHAEDAGSRFDSCEFKLNHAEAGGGAVRLMSGSHELAACVFSGNSAANQGGGLWLDDCANIVVDHCLFFSNTAGTEGGAVSVDDSQVTVEYCTIDGNTAPSGAGMACDQTTLIQLGSTSVTGNYTGEGVACHAYTNIAIGCTNIWGNDGGDWVGPIAGLAGDYDNLALDPMYCSPGVGDFQLNIASPLSEGSSACGQIGALGVGCGEQTFVVLADGSGDHPTIQDALDAASWGDTVLLGNGVFSGDGNRDLHFDGKAITLTSQSGNPALCVIDCNASSSNTHRGFNFDAVDGPGVQVSCLTVRNAWKNYGGAMRINGGSPTIELCIIEENVSNNGAGVAVSGGGSPTFTRCTFRENHATNAGGGLHTSAVAAPQLVDCIFSQNFATWGGGGFYAYGPTEPSFEGCLFVGNSSEHWGGAFHTQVEGAEADLVSCTFFGNHAPDGGVGFCRGGSHAAISNSILSDSPEGEAIYCSSEGTATLSCTNVWGHAGGDWVGGIAGQDLVEGNLTVDPGYCDPASGLFTLVADSPCLPAGNDCEVQMGAFGVGCSDGPMVRLVEADGSGVYPTIQSAVDASFHGDTILLSSGLFTGEGNRDVDLKGLQLRIGSQGEDAMTCIIDCQGTEGAPRRAFRIDSGEGPDTVIQDLTISGGWKPNGAGIFINGASPVITRCRFVNNESSNGGGIYVGGDSSPYINDCDFTLNSASNAGAGVRFTGSGGVVENCHFKDNYGHYGGGGIYIYLSAVSVQGCLFEANSCHVYGSALEIQAPDHAVSIDGCTFVGGISSDGVVRVRQSTVPVFSHCLFAFSQEGQAISCDATSSVSIQCSDIYGNEGGDWVGSLSGLGTVDGNFSSDPLFCGFDVGDYQVMNSSPCLPDGNSCDQQIGAFGMSCVVSPVLEQQLPNVASLKQNYPNPFNPSTTIGFSLPHSAKTSVRVFDVRGRLVKTLVQEVLDAGSHTIVWRGNDNRGRPVASGVYWCMLKNEDITATRKMMLLK